MSVWAEKLIVSAYTHLKVYTFYSVALSRIPLLWYSVTPVKPTSAAAAN